MPILLAIKRTAWTLAFITADAETIAVELYSSAMAVIAGIWLIANSQILYKIQSFGNLYWWGYILYCDRFDPTYQSLMGDNLSAMARVIRVRDVDVAGREYSS